MSEALRHFSILLLSLPILLSLLRLHRSWSLLGEHIRDAEDLVKQLEGGLCVLSIFLVEISSIEFLKVLESVNEECSQEIALEDLILLHDQVAKTGD